MRLCGVTKVNQVCVLHLRGLGILGPLKVRHLTSAHRCKDSGGISLPPAVIDLLDWLRRRHGLLPIESG